MRRATKGAGVEQRAPLEARRGTGRQRQQQRQGGPAGTPEAAAKKHSTPGFAEHEPMIWRLPR